MALMRVRIANTEAIAKYYPTYKGVRLHKIVTTNYNGKGRRPIRLDKDNQLELEKIIYECLAEKIEAMKVVVVREEPALCLTI